MAEAHVDVMPLDELLQARKARRAPGLIFRERAGLDAIVPAPCGVRCVTRHKDRTARRSREVCDAPFGVAGNPERPDGAVAEQVEDAVEAAARIGRERELA